YVRGPTGSAADEHRVALFGRRRLRVDRSRGDRARAAIGAVLRRPADHRRRGGACPVATLQSARAAAHRISPGGMSTDETWVPWVACRERRRDRVSYRRL